MAIRVSQRGMYNNSVSNMNQTLSQLMDSNTQAASQKKINKPSDDPIGMARILTLRTAQANNEQYTENAENANAWLSQQSQALTSAQTVLVRIKELTEQGSSGTYEGTREQLAVELRECFEQLVNIANTKFDGRHIFSGHKYDQPAFVQSLNVTCYDENWADVQYKVTGDADYTTVVQFLEDGQVGAGSTAAVNFRYSKDGGKTWTNGATTPGSNVLDLNGVQVEIQPKAPATTVDVQATDPDDPTRDDDLTRDGNGTWLYVRPTAVYKGDDNYSPGTVDVVYDAAGITLAEGRGDFHRDVAVRIDEVTGAGVRYSYSTDGGANWTSKDSDATTLPMQLEVPGGFLVLNGTSLADGDQFVIKPRRADLEFMVSDDQYVKVNNVGSDIFGGLFQIPGDAWATTVRGGGSTNMFEVVGRIVAAAETNSQQGMQEGLPELETIMKELTKEMAKIGGKQNRLEITAGILEEENYNIASRTSQIEDVDVSVLMAQMAQQQFAYQAVLKSSSMIMQMSLVNML